MSWLANVMISVGVDDNENAEALSEWRRTDAPAGSSPERGGAGYLRLLTSAEDSQWGGWKAPECEVWAGALNHADLGALGQRFFEMPWREPNAAQLFVMDQEEGALAACQRRPNRPRLRRRPFASNRVHAPPMCVRVACSPGSRFSTLIRVASSSTTRWRWPILPDAWSSDRWFRTGAPNLHPRSGVSPRRRHRLCLDRRRGQGA